MMTNPQTSGMRDLCPTTLQLQHSQLRNRPAVHVESLSTTIAQLNTHTLEQQNDVALLNRVDTKYLLSLETLKQVLADASAEYTALEIDEHRLMTYQTTYFDSPSMRYFRHHHSGKLNRHKVRYRRYAETDNEFVEVKFKTNKKRTIKHRELLSTVDTAAQDSQNFARAYLDSKELDSLEAILHVNYQRLSLVDKSGTQRVTIDMDLRFQRFGSAELVHIPDLVIVERKREKAARPGFFDKLMKTADAKKSNFSKYCIGCCLTDDNTLKKNRFLPMLKHLQEYQQHTVTIEPQPL